MVFVEKIPSFEIRMKSRGMPHLWCFTHLGLDGLQHILFITGYFFGIVHGKTDYPVSPKDEFNAAV